MNSGTVDVNRFIYDAVVYTGILKFALPIFISVIINIFVVGRLKLIIANILNIISPAIIIGIIYVCNVIFNYKEMANDTSSFEGIFVATLLTFYWFIANLFGIFLAYCMKYFSTRRS